MNSIDRHFPDFDYELSPYTGWTRAHWEYILARMTYGYARRAERYGSPARVLYPDDRRGLPDSVDAIESFARIASAWGAWLCNPANPAALTFQDHESNVESLLHQALLDGTNPSNPHTYWGDIGHMDQRIVESADIALAIWMSRERVFYKMTSAEQAQVMDWLAQVDGKGTYTDNWILFTAMAQAVRHHLGLPAPLEDLDNRLMQISEFYRGDGWYVDGPTDEFELYNAWMFGWHYLLWTWIDGDRRPDHRQQVLERGRSFIEGFLHFFGPNGSYPAWGRSVVYRFAAVAPFAVGHFLKIAPDDPGLLRRVSSGCIRYFYDSGLFDPEDHFVRQGYHGEFPPAGEAYISPGSPYWCCHGLFGLTLDRDDPFWTAIESPLPVEREDFELALPAPGFVLSGRKETGQVLLLNSRSGQEHDAPRHNYTSKYGKLAYSTHFPFNVLAVRGSYAPDAMISLTADGQTFGHRTHTRAGQVAPGFSWSKFDEIINGEPQPLWVGVLLYGDIQIRLTVIRPTFPVMAFEAPGALGCEGPTKIRRRSDDRAGWEYVEAEGRAIGIQRLVGYNCQDASAPFLDQSNINLAYSYSEQPVVYESHASVAARCLAAASLVRPTSFDPAVEFAGIKVEIETPEIFRISLPNQTMALVAPGETTPKHITVNGIDVEGVRLRYAQVSKDLDEICGLGVTRLSGLATFSEPAAFRLKRMSDKTIHLTTNTGISLMKEWLNGEARYIEVKTIDHEWLEVTERATSNSIPSQLVRESSDRNQRTLVDFRIHV
ncbi:MAG TPA: DUF2264 domain-containing protein [Anaerolineales bacterium]|nr:DUF2264 domain-containing protein [Anaerolineales bacterium]